MKNKRSEKRIIMIASIIIEYINSINVTSDWKIVIGLMRYFIISNLSSKNKTKSKKTGTTENNMFLNALANKKLNPPVRPQNTKKAKK